MCTTCAPYCCVHVPSPPLDSLYLCFQEEFDMHDPKGHSFAQLSFLRKRSKIVEIVSAKDIIFALAQSGACAAFSRGWY